MHYECSSLKANLIFGSESDNGAITSHTLGIRCNTKKYYYIGTVKLRLSIR